MGQLIVCGDSFMSPVQGKFAGTHFSELIAKQLNYELIAYSRGGMSNGGICLQIQAAIDLQPKPSLILLGTTSPDRMEWPINEITEVEKFNLNDVLYGDDRFTSFNNFGSNEKAQLVSTPISDIFGHYKTKAYYKLDNQIGNRISALKNYFEFLYHPDWKREQDKLMLYAMFHKLHKTGIPYIICYEGVKGIVDNCDWLNYGGISKNYAASEITTLISNFYDSRYNDSEIAEYHTSVHTQITIANILLEKYI